MTTPAQGIEPPDESALLALFRAIASRDHPTCRRTLVDDPGLAAVPLRTGASRQDPLNYFLRPIHHHVYSGDTALHVAAAAHDPLVASLLISRGADVRARNRRGAQPLHYAADGATGDDNRDPEQQYELISYLLDAGADPNAFDKSGVAPLHRAVRTRSSAAVAALIDKGADPRLMNKSGSTPLHLGVQNTGKSHSGSEVAKEEQRRIIGLLLGHGASPADLDAKGKSVLAAASSDWVRQLLGAC